MKNKKVSLKELKVKSFVTATIPDEKTVEFNGGATAYHGSGCWTNCGYNTCNDTCGCPPPPGTWCSECASLRGLC